MNDEELFHLALEKPIGERSAFVDRACAGDASRRRRVEALLRSHETPDSFLEGAAADGASMASVAPAALCPRCLLGNARGDDPHVTFPLLPGGAGRVLETLAATVGPIPRVLLTDAQGQEDRAPVIQPSSPEMPSPADRSGRVTLLGEIARGGMGAVLKGHDSDIGRELAVKVLLEGHRDKPEFVRRFVEEAQISGQLQHPGIVPVYDLGIFDDARPYFTMKLVKGRTLSQLLADRSTEAERSRFLGIFEQVAQTVAYAHARGVIHRDLKPSNIMVGSFGEVQVMDWGLAKVLPRGGVADDESAGRAGVSDKETLIATDRGEFNSDLSRPGSVMGTPSYMAPEQAAGEIDAVDERADVFALGSILCEILTGRPAYSGRSSADILARARRADLTEAQTRLDACGADVELTGLARKCLATDLDHRPRDARVVADAMSAHFNGVQERLRTAELNRVAAQGRARLTVAAAASIVLLVLLGTGGWTWVRAERAIRAAATARQVDKALQTATILWGRARSASPDDLVPWTEALAQARQAEALLGNAAGDAATAARVQAVVGPLAREHEQAVAVERDRRFVARLEVIRAPMDVVLDMTRGNAEFTAAFHEVGLDVDALPPAEVGARIAARPDAAEVAAALDEWTHMRRSLDRADEAGARRLVAVAKVADPDPWRNRLRDAITNGDVAALRRLAAEVDPDRLPVQSAGRLAGALVDLSSDIPAAVALLRPVLRRHPDDFWANWDFAGHLRRLNPPRLDEAVRYFTAAVAVRPRSGIALYGLSEALTAKGDYPEAIATAREAIRVQPRFLSGHRALAYALDGAGRHAEAISTLIDATRTPSDDRRLYRAYCYHDLARCLGAAGRVDEAIAAYKEVVRLNPDLPDPYFDLGVELFRKGDGDGSIVAFREGIRRSRNLSDRLIDFAGTRPEEAIAVFRTLPRNDPANADILVSLAHSLKLVGRLEESVVASRDAIRLKPDSSRAHQVLGWALLSLRDSEGAIVAYREAIRLKPTYVTMESYAREELAWALRRTGRFEEAIGEYRAAIGLGHRVASLESRIAETRRELDLWARLSAVLKGEDKPKDTAERLAFAYLCDSLGRHATAARFWAEILAADPKIGDDRQTQHRYNAACDAALAGSGKAKDEPASDEPARAKLRRQALEWLMTEKAAWAALLDGRDPKARAFVAQTLRHWQVDSDLAGVRDAEALAKLPDAEQREWRSLWDEVEALREKSRGDHP